MRYVVLQPTDAGHYIEVSRLEAGSPAHAVEQAATGEGAYIAVQEYRFTPMTVAPVQAFRVVSNGADPTAK
jgi:hypothetical protein